MNKQLNYIGIDPAFREAGFCVCRIYPNKDVEFYIMTFLEFITFADILPLNNTFVGVENSHKQKKTFKEGANIAIAKKLSRDAGKNMAISQSTFDVCFTKWGDKAYSISPKEKGATWDNATFLAVVKAEGHNLLNYKGNISEHDKRAAYQIALKTKWYSDTDTRPQEPTPKKMNKAKTKDTNKATSKVNSWAAFAKANPNRIIKK